MDDKPAFVRKLRRLTASKREFVDRRWQCRRASLLSVDDGVGAIVRALERAGKLNNTVIMLTSDNGYLSGEHRLSYGKIHHYEESSRVPLVVSGPGFPAGATVSDPVANVDLAPTIAALGRAAPRRVMDGVDLGPTARRPDEHPDRDILLTQLQREGIPPYVGIRTPAHKYIEHATGERELYDLRRDPHELISRHADPRYAQIRRSLARRLARLRSCAGASCRR